MSSNIIELTEAFHQSLGVQDIPPADGVAIIQDLPTEVMTRIFFMATEHGYFSRTLTEAALLALSICRVCRYWRTIVLSLPRFWGSIIDVVVLSDKEVAQFIEWSKPAPIDIFLDGSDELLQLLPPHMLIARINSIQSRFSLVLQELERITRLYVRRLELSERLCLQLQKPAPNLVHCTFEGGDQFSPLRLTPLLFNNAPKLHTLSLHCALIDFSKVTYPELKAVSINKIRARHAPTVRSWLYFLSHHPLLESVDIRHCTTEDYDNALDEVQPIDLHNLRELVLADVSTQVTDFLHHIIIPHHCNVTILSSLSLLISHPNHRSFQAACSRLMYTRLTKSLQVNLSGINIQFSNIITGDTWAMVEESDSSFQPKSILKFQWNNRFHPMDPSLFPNRPFAFFPQIYMTNIERLRLVFPSFEGRFAYQDKVLTSIFRQWLEGLTEVKHLILDRNAFYHVFEIMHPRSRDSDSESSDGRGRGLYNQNHELEACDDDNYNHYNHNDGDRQIPVLFPALEGVEIMSVEGFFEWDSFIMFAECRKDLGYPVSYVTVPKRDINSMSWEEIGQVSELDIEINLK